MFVCVCFFYVQLCVCVFVCDLLRLSSMAAVRVVDYFAGRVVFVVVCFGVCAFACVVFALRLLFAGCVGVPLLVVFSFFCYFVLLCVLCVCLFVLYVLIAVCVVFFRFVAWCAYCVLCLSAGRVCLCV